ncbi:DNA-binding transcriptional regulator GalS [Escherichia coli]|nr:DNA-binding transcriptional regulator GalS [Escherichia coli]
MITIRDVARQAGVSVATVSRVLNNSTLVSADTREAVMKAVSELDYRPNANAQAWQLRLATHWRGGDGRF